MGGLQVLFEAMFARESFRWTVMALVSSELVLFIQTMRVHMGNELAPVMEGTGTMGAKVSLLFAHRTSSWRTSGWKIILEGFRRGSFGFKLDFLLRRF
jgi:hypothetical protein